MRLLDLVTLSLLLMFVAPARFTMAELIDARTALYDPAHRITISPVINPLGQVAFTAREGRDVWSDASGTMSIIAYYSQVPPGSSGHFTWGNVQHPVYLSAAGIAALPASTYSQTATGAGVWIGTSSPLNLEILYGGPVAGEPGLEMGFSLYSIKVNSSTTFLLEGSLFGAGVGSFNNRAVIRWDLGSGAGKILARTGDPAPGLPPGSVFSRLETDPVINDHGQAAFAAHATQGPGGASVGGGIWRVTHEGLEVAVKRGDPMPGDGTFVTFERPKMNNAGDLVYTARRQGGGIGLFKQVEGLAPQLIAFSGQPAPGTANNFAAFAHSVINRDGHVAFRADLDLKQANPPVSCQGVSGGAGVSCRVGDPGQAGLKLWLCHRRSPLQGQRESERPYPDIDGSSVNIVSVSATPQRHAARRSARDCS